MSRYLLSVHSVQGEVRDPMTDAELQQSWKQLHLLEQEMRSAGAWVFSGRLHEPDTATVVRSSGGEVVTTDGPFVESKGAPGRLLRHPGRRPGRRAGLGVEGHQRHQGADRGPPVRRFRR